MRAEDTWIREWGWRLAGVFASLGLIVFGLILFRRGGQPFGAADAIKLVGPLLFAAAGLVALATVLAFPIAGWLGERMSSAMYFSSEREAPPLTYDLAERYENEMKWELCLQEYGRIVTYHPQERAAWLGCMRVALVGFEDPALARRILRKARWKMRDAGSREALDRQWAELRREWSEQQAEAESAA